MSHGKGQDAFNKFKAFLVERDAANDWPEWADRTGCVLSPQKVSEALGIGTAALRQNSGIADARARIEQRLQEEGVFLVPKEKTTDPSSAPVTSMSASKDKARIKQLEDKNAELREENATLKRMLKKANMFEEHLLQTGRALPL
jgi:hypothetical protein